MRPGDQVTMSDNSCTLHVQSSLVRHGEIAAELGNCHVDPYVCPDACLFPRIYWTFIYQIAVKVTRM
jgi:hypothetical protein